jgi:GTP-binding protein
VERTSLLVHLVDVTELSGRKPVDDFKVVMKELASFSEELAAKPMFVIASKIDAAQDRKRADSLRRMARRRGLPFYAVSSATGEGIEELTQAMAVRVLQSSGALKT